MDPVKAAQEEAAKTQEYSGDSDFIRLPILPKWNDGETRYIRILPPVEALKWLLDNPDESFQEYCANDIGPALAWRTVYLHFGIQGKGVLPCRRMINKPCPICEAYEEDKDSPEKVVRESAENIKPQEKVTFFVLVRDWDDQGPYIWTTARKWANKVFSKFGNPDYELEYDPLEGRDLRITRKGAEFNNTDYEVDRKPDKSFIYSVEGEDEDGAYIEPDFDKMRELAENLPSIGHQNDPVLSYDLYEQIINDEITIKEAYGIQFGSDEDTEFDTDKIEEEEEKEKKPTPRRRRRKKR
jgi:hypothetical protein